MLHCVFRSQNDNLNELEVIESKRNAIRKGLVCELLNARNTVLCSYFAQRNGEPGDYQHWTRYFKGWATFSNADFFLSHSLIDREVLSSDQNRV